MSNLSMDVWTQTQRMQQRKLPFFDLVLLTSVVLSVVAFGRGSTRQIKDFRTAGHAAPTLLSECALTRVQWGWW